MGSCFGRHNHFSYGIAVAKHGVAVQPDDNYDYHINQQAVPGLSVRPDRVHHLEVIEWHDQKAAPEALNRGVNNTVKATTPAKNGMKDQLLCGVPPS